MIILWIILVVFLLIAAFPLWLVTSELFRITFRNGVPSISSTWAVVDHVIAARVLPTSGLILDLGCGRSWTLRRFWRSGIRGPLIGYEKAFAPWAFGASWNWATRTPIKVVHDDLVNAPIEKAKGIYLFLLPATLKELGPVLRRRASSGIVVVSAEFSIPGWSAEQVLEARGVTSRKAKIYVYRIGM